MLNFLVTGAAGFIGSNTVEALLKEGYGVVGLDDLSTGKQTNIDFLNSLNGRFDFVKASILDRELVDKLVSDCDFVIHLAAFVSSPNSINQPHLTHETNVTGTLNIFEAVSKYHRVKRVVYASSSALYGDASEMPIGEDSPSKILTPYSASKKACEVYADAFSASYEFDAIGLRYFNVYGPRQAPSSEYSGVVSLFMDKLQKNQPITVYGDGEQSRDFVYVKDVSDINIKLCFCEKDPSHLVLNVGTGESVSINDLADAIASKLDIDYEAIHKPPRKGDIIHSRSNIDRLKKYIEHPISYGLVEGISDYIDCLLT